MLKKLILCTGVMLGTVTAGAVVPPEFSVMSDEIPAEIPAVPVNEPNGFFIHSKPDGAEEKLGWMFGRIGTEITGIPENKETGPFRVKRLEHFAAGGQYAVMAFVIQMQKEQKQWNLVLSELKNSSGGKIASDNLKLRRIASRRTFPVYSCDMLIRPELGPVAKIPSTYTIWADIYSPAFIKKLKDLCLEAESAAEDVQTKKRIRFMKQKLLQPLEEESSNYFRGLNSLKDWQFHIPGEIYLRPLKGETAELKTKVSISETPESFIFLFECEEPQMDSMVSMAEKNDDPAIASTDSCIEIMLNPSGDRMHCIHIAVNGNGAIFDRMNVGGTHGDITWNSNAGVDVTRRANSWTARVSLPKKMLGGYDPKGFPVNFARQRIVKDAPPLYYHWSPLPRRNFHEARYYGIMRLDNSKESNLVLNPDFVQENPVSKLPLHWSFWREDENSVVCCDEKVFISGGKSLYMKNTKGKRVTAGMKLNGLKPNTDYLLSFYARTRNLAGRGGAGIHVSFGGLKRYPRNYLPETMPWSRFEYRIRTKKEISEKETIGLWIWFAEGEVWFDRIALKELPQKEGNK